MSPHLPLTIAAVFAGQLAGGDAPPPRVQVPLTDTAAALAPLLAAAATPIICGSSCDAEIAGKPRRTLGYVLADKLLGFDEGRNQIAGGCTGGQCRVVLTHRGDGEEDLFQFEYRFRVERGRLVPRSLSCFGT